MHLVRSSRFWVGISLLLGVAAIFFVISDHRKLLADFHEVVGGARKAPKAALRHDKDASEKVVRKMTRVKKTEANRVVMGRERSMVLYEGLDTPPASHVLSEADEKAANVIFFVWCGKSRLFEFRHMLSVLSAIRIQQPLQVTIYHWPGEPPLEDLYNDWLTELQSTFHHFQVTPIKVQTVDTEKCEKGRIVSELFRKLPQGGMFLDENVILLQQLDSGRRDGIIVGKNKDTPSIVVTKQYTAQTMRAKPLDSCVSREDFDDKPDTLCIILKTGQLYPVDIMTSDEPFAEIVRRLFYGSHEMMKPHFNLSSPIPNIGHYYLHKKVKLSLFTYLSIYSLITVMDVEMVYVHSNIKPYGNYWQRLLQSRKVTYVFCPPTVSVFGQELLPTNSTLAENVMKVYLLYLYGGVFLSEGVIVTQPLSENSRGYDVIMSYDSKKPQDSSTFPEMLSTGIIAAKPHSIFLSLWLRRYKDTLHLADALIPYKLYERYPQAVNLDVNLQVVCSGKGISCQRPLKMHHTKASFNLDIVNAVNFAASKPREFVNEKRLRLSKTMIGRIGQKVMGWF